MKELSRFCVENLFVSYSPLSCYFSSYTGTGNNIVLRNESGMEDEMEAVVTAPWWVWLILSIIAGVSFWCQAVVTEERLVPALNVISDYYNIPNDIAGATLMAAGASSPELFSSFVSLFITHSSLGLGTIVGSEIFNQLIICAGAVYASKSGTLQLDKAIVIREVGFYALSIVLLYVALQDVEPTDDDTLGVDHIFISFWEACMVFGGYILYVIVCANMDAIVAFFTRTTEALSAQGKKGYGTIRTHKVSLDEQIPLNLAYVTKHQNLSTEPKANWKEVEYIMPAESFQTTSEEERLQAFSRMRSSGSSISNKSFRRGSSLLARSFRDSISKIGNGMLVDLIMHSERPTQLHSIHDLEDNEVTKVFRCFLWQASPFYTKARFCSHAWHLRWFTITDNEITSVPDRQDPERHRMRYPRFTELHVDDDRLIIRMINPINDKRNYTIMAPSKKIFLAVLEKLEGFMKWNATIRGDSIVDDSKATEDQVDDEVENTDVHVELIEFPCDTGIFGAVMFICLFPLRFIMHWTLPDVRQMDCHGDTNTGINTALFATFMCLVWLVIGSYAMVASLESLAELMDIPDAVIGFTVSAAGTSLPNYVASKVAAENGFGNQAVSNAFGSNTFNIMVGLGLPWMLYTSFGTGFQPYHGLPAEGILESIVIMATVLLVFVVLMLTSNFVIYKWHGVFYVILYVFYVTYAIAEVYMK